MNAPSPLLQSTFLLLPLLLVFRAWRATGSGKREAFVAGAWLLFTGALAAGGLLTRFDTFPPPLLRVVLPTLLITRGVGLSPLARGWIQSWSLASMVAFQSFRLPLELLMHQAAREGVMPVQMSFSGRNFDIVTGLLALPLSLWLSRGGRSRAVVWLWNLLGLALLCNVVGVAIASFPGPLRLFHQEPANLWVTTFPFVWLPTVMVPLALAGHVLIARKLKLGVE